MIKFPQVHIANSVVNRILNVADGIEDTRNQAARAAQVPPPVVPDTTEQSAALDSALATGLPELPGIDQAPDPGATLAGTPLLSTVLEPGQ